VTGVAVLAVVVARVGVRFGSVFVVVVMVPRMALDVAVNQNPHDDAQYQDAADKSQMQLHLHLRLSKPQKR
jgi:cytochrome b561